MTDNISHSYENAVYFSRMGVEDWWINWLLKEWMNWNWLLEKWVNWNWFLKKWVNWNWFLEKWMNWNWLLQKRMLVWNWL